MKERPILFSTPMVQAILAGRKSQTRRIIKPQPRCSDNHLTLGWDPEYVGWANEPFSPVLSDGVMYCGNCGEYVHFNGAGLKIPYGKTGDVLWVRETYCYVMYDHCHDLLEGASDRNQNVYKASIHPDWMEYAKEKYGYKWKPSIFMPKEACRIRLEITNIRVERVQDISTADAIAEGIVIEETPFIEPINAYASLWNEINGKKSWYSNPWVWVISFKKIEAL